MLVRDRMTREVVSVSPSTNLFDALMLTRTQGVRHLPVLDGGALVGLVTDRDLRLAMPAKGTAPEKERERLLATSLVGDVMTRNLVTTTPDAPVEEAARLLYEHYIGCLPVLSEGRVVGLLTETDLLRALVELVGAREPSSRIEILLPNRPGELARVIRLIGIDYRINVIGLIAPPTAGLDAKVTIHLQTTDPGEIVDALEKLGYPVGWPTLGAEVG